MLDLRTVPGDGIKCDPDMNLIGRSAGNGWQGKFLPIQVTFNALTR